MGCVNNSSCLCQHCLGFLETRLASPRSVLPSLTVSSRGLRQHRVLLEFPAVFLSVKVELFISPGCFSDKRYAKSMRASLRVYFKVPSVESLPVMRCERGEKSFLSANLNPSFLQEFRFILMAMDWTVFLLICLPHLHSLATHLGDEGVPACLPPHLCLRLSHLSAPRVRRWADFTLTHPTCLVLSGGLAGRATRRTTSRRLNKRGRVQ